MGPVGDFLEGTIIVMYVTFVLKWVAETAFKNVTCSQVSLQHRSIEHYKNA